MEKPIAIQQNTIKHETVQTVNARDLHAFLESKQDFSTWIKNASLLILFLKGKILSASTKNGSEQCYSSKISSHPYRGALTAS